LRVPEPAHLLPRDRHPPPAGGGRPPHRGGEQADRPRLPLADQAAGLEHGLALARRQPARRAARRACRVPLPSLAPRGARLRDLPARHGLGAAPCRRGGAGRGRAEPGVLGGLTPLAPVLSRGPAASIIVTVVALLSPPAPALALNFFELEVYPATTEGQGLHEVESLTTLVANGRRPNEEEVEGEEPRRHRLLRTTVEYNYGLTDKIDVAAYTDLARAGALRVPRALRPARARAQVRRRAGLRLDARERPGDPEAPGRVRVHVAGWWQGARPPHLLNRAHEPEEPPRVRRGRLRHR